MIRYLKKAKEPFVFCTRLNLCELTGLKARNLLELLQHIKNVPGSSIYHHTHEYIEKRSEMTPELTNDFANWVFNVLGEHELGEELASIDVLEFFTIRALRERIISSIEQNLFERTENLRYVSGGREFEFIRSHSFILPTWYVAHTLGDFLRILKKVTTRSIYFHMFEARLRLEKGVNDFSFWLEDSLGCRDAAVAISSLDPYTHSLEGLRRAIIACIRQG